MSNSNKIDPEYKKYLTNLHFVANSVEGQAVLAGILDELGTFEPAWNPKNAQLAKAAVLKDFGQNLLDDIAIASPEAHDSINKQMRLSRLGGVGHQIFTTDKEIKDE